jgi:hypothetical protein
LPLFRLSAKEAAQPADDRAGGVNLTRVDAATTAAATPASVVVAAAAVIVTIPVAIVAIAVTIPVAIATIPVIGPGGRGYQADGQDRNRPEGGDPNTQNQ